MRYLRASCFSFSFFLFIPRKNTLAVAQNFIRKREGEVKTLHKEQRKEKKDDFQDPSEDVTENTWMRPSADDINLQ